jgi:hypothetical protein
MEYDELARALCDIVDILADEWWSSGMDARVVLGSGENGEDG